MACKRPAAADPPPAAGAADDGPPADEAAADAKSSHTGLDETYKQGRVYKNTTVGEYTVTMTKQKKRHDLAIVYAPGKKQLFQVSESSTKLDIEIAFKVAMDIATAIVDGKVRLL
eukprot:5336145-Pyramimonas_sp.AAC.1